MGVHDGHRQRMKKRFLEHGLDNFDDVNVLELLLFYAQPRQDTNAMAHALLDRFGSLSAVLEASPSELQTVSGIGGNAAALLRAGISSPGSCTRRKRWSTPCCWTPGSSPSAAGR